MNDEQRQALLDLSTNDELLEIARLAVQQTLIEFRDNRISVWRNNGLVIKEKDGKDSSIIRLGFEQAMRVGLKAIIDHEANK